jgi:hypothetical protein
MASTPSLQSLPRDILIMLPEFIHNIEDYTNLSSTCRLLRITMATAFPNQILRLAAAQSNIFLRPSPLFLLAATARELGNWARQSDENEWELVRRCEDGFPGLMDLALEHCGLTLARIRELHLLRFSVINPVHDVVDRRVGPHWYTRRDIWSLDTDSEWSPETESEDTLFHLAIYGELFGPDMESFLNQRSQDWASGKLDPISRIDFLQCLNDTEKFALTWTTQSSGFKAYWKETRALVGADFCEGFRDDWCNPDGTDTDGEDSPDEWKQRLWENVMLCQGLEGLGMMMPHLRTAWADRVRAWRHMIAGLTEEPESVIVYDDCKPILEYPFLLGDVTALYNEWRIP